jgi:hypothetical protein
LHDVTLYWTYINEAELMNQLAAHGYQFVSSQRAASSSSGTGVSTHVFQRS